MSRELASAPGMSAIASVTVRSALARLRACGVQQRLVAALDSSLRGRVARRWIIGVSGGVDSTALLLGLVLLRSAWQAEGRRVPTLRALHVHHGLAAEADDWARQARGLALAMDVPVLDARAQVDGSSETAARAARYVVFERTLGAGDLLLLAHHADDDAETVLMDVLRGAGVRAMPRQRTLGAGMLVRPLLSMPRAELAAVVAAAAIEPVDDPANADRRHARSLLRHHLLPLADAHWPGVDRRLRQLAQAQSERDAALAMLLQPLLRRGVDDDGGLRLSSLRSQPLPIARALLSAWLLPQAGPVPGRQVNELLRQLLTVEDTARLATTVRGHRLRCHRDTAYLLAAAAWSAATSGGRRPKRQSIHGAEGWFDDSRPGTPDGASAASSWQWDGVSPLDLVVGRLHRLPAIQGMRWPDAGVLVQLRRGGERLQLHEGGPHREVKALLREAGVPAWQRAHWPLVFLATGPLRGGREGSPGEALDASAGSGGGEQPGTRLALLAVPAVGVAHGWRAAPGEAGFTLAFDPARATV